MRCRIGKLDGTGEDNLTEFKVSFDRRQVRKTLVAFANSVQKGQQAALFLGVRDDGSPEGVDGPDSVQQKVREICEVDCYPPIRFEAEAISLDGKPVLVISVPHSNTKPHFAGPAFVRRGSESVTATADEYERLILSRSDKCAAILSWEAQVITVMIRGKQLGSTERLNDRNYRVRADCRVLDCNSHYLRLHVLNSGTNVTEPIRNVTVSYDEERHRPMLVVDETE